MLCFFGQLVLVFFLKIFFKNEKRHCDTIRNSFVSWSRPKKAVAPAQQHWLRYTKMFLFSTVAMPNFQRWFFNFSLKIRETFLCQKELIFIKSVLVDFCVSNQIVCAIILLKNFFLMTLMLIWTFPAVFLDQFGLINVCALCQENQFLLFLYQYTKRYNTPLLW